VTEPVIHAAMPDAERSLRHIGRTYAVCRVWAHDIYVRETLVAHGQRFLPKAVNCGNCWARVGEGKLRKVA
jgi:hypothetical protein